MTENNTTLGSAFIMLTILVIFFMCSGAWAATYYADFKNGDDSHSGTSPVTAWKHAPGDPNAEGKADVTLKDGDIVLFKGGVKYRGRIMINSDGVTYKGNGWGTAKAIIDGSVPLTNWNRCSSALECSGNPNWQNIYYTTVLSGTKALTSNLYQDDEMLYVAQYPNPVDPFFMDNRDYYLEASSVSDTSLVDSRLSAIGNDLVGGYVFLSASSNEVKFSKVTSFNASENRIFFDPISSPKRKYAISNSINGMVLDKQGEYYVNESTRRVYLWPLNDKDATRCEITISVLSKTINIGSHDKITIDGLILQKGLYNAIEASYGTEEITVKNCEIVKYRSDSISNAVGFETTTNSLFEKNYFHMNARMRGLSTKGRNIKYVDNTVVKVGRTAMWFLGCTDCEIKDNYIYNCTGVHSNGISCYSNCNNVSITGNIVLQSNNSLTLQNVDGITVSYNIFNGGGQYPMGIWNDSSPASNITLDHNILLGYYSSIYRSPKKSIPGLVMKNNIFAGLTDRDGQGEYGYNIYTDIAGGQKSLNSTEMLIKDLSRLFLDPNNFDYTPKPDSPACGAGEEGSDIGPIPCGDSAPDHPKNPKIIEVFP